MWTILLQRVEHVGRCELRADLAVSGGPLADQRRGSRQHLGQSVGEPA